MQQHPVSVVLRWEPIMPSPPPTYSTQARKEFQFFIKINAKRHFVSESAELYFVLQTSMTSRREKAKRSVSTYLSYDAASFLQQRRYGDFMMIAWMPEVIVRAHVCIHKYALCITSNNIGGCVLQHKEQFRIFMQWRWTKGTGGTWSCIKGGITSLTDVHLTYLSTTRWDVAVWRLYVLLFIPILRN